MTKILAVVMVVLILAGGAYFYLQSHKAQTLTNNSSATTQVFPQSSTAPSASPVVKSGLTNKTDTSDSALDKDFTEVQNSLNKLDKDQTAANLDTSSQDTPTAQ